MDLGIAGKAALVGGASSGIGLAVARSLAAEGARVALVARREAETEAAAQAIREEFRVESLAISADLLREGECERAVAEAAGRLGTLSIVIPNAGGPRAAPFSELTDADWEGAFRLSFLTTVRLVRAAIPHLQKGGGGSVVTIGSLVTQEPRPDLTLSSGVRTGLVALTRILARRYGPDRIRVNMVSPGYTKTRRQVELANAERERTGRSAEDVFHALAADIPLGRLAEPEEIGSVVAFLCSERAAYVSGINLLVDGGQARGI